MKWATAAALATVGVLFVIDATWPPWPAAAARFANNAVQLAVAGAAAALAFRAYRHRGRDKSWLFIALGCGAWSAGQLVWTVYEDGLGVEVPFPSAADIGFLAFPFLALVALGLRIDTPASALSRLRAVVEACSITASLLFLSWMLVLSDLFAGSDGNVFETVVAAAYPIADSIVLAVCWFALTRSDIKDRGQLGLVTAAMAAISVSDSAFLYLTQTDSYKGTQLVDLGWISGFALFVIAAASALDGSTGSHASPATKRAAPRLLGFALLAPHVPMLAGGVLAAIRYAHGIPLDGFLIADAMVVLVLLVVQQATVIYENNAIRSTLEERVAARTQALASAESYFRVLVEGSSDVIMVLDRDLHIRALSVSSERIFGIDSVHARDRRIDELFNDPGAEPLLSLVKRASARPDGTWQVEWSFADSNNRRRHIETSIANRLDEPAVKGIVLNSRDIGERKALEQELRHQAFHDSLTQLANRALFLDRAEHAFARNSRSGARIAVAIIDIDDFKTVNDSLGHAAGDEVLAVIAERLRRTIRQGDTVARLGGDEFAVLLEDGAEAGAAQLLADRLIEAISLPMIIDDREHSLDASVGIAISTPQTRDIAELVRNADTAMYVAKANGKGRSIVFATEMHHQAVERLSLRTELRHAIDLGELTLHYQPTIDLQSGHLDGFEALVRWQHPARGLLYPGSFVPLAEETGLIVPLGRWVLREACGQAAQWNAARAGRPLLAVAVNVSARQLSYGGIVDDVARALAQSHLDAGLLVLEITESVLVDNSSQTVSTLDALKNLGVQLAIDDFGTGYASLSYLQRLPIDFLKIDKTFVDQVAQSEQGMAFFKAILNLGQTLQLRTVAEGIEEPDQLAVLRSIGCEIGQGYHFSRPVEAGAIDEVIDRWTSAVAGAWLRGRDSNSQPTD